MCLIRNSPAAAPSIDDIAPDIYISDYARYIKVLDGYHRPDNAMFVTQVLRVTLMTF